MNKRGSAEVYLLVLVIVTILSLTALTYAIQESNSKRPETVGLSSVALIKAYDEGEKIKLYLDHSLKKASADAVTRLKENGGYPDEIKCALNPLTGESINLKNNCPSLDINENFRLQLNLEMQKYLKNYKSAYKETKPDYPELAELYEKDIFDISDAYTRVVNNAKVRDITLSPTLTMELEPITLLIEHAPKSHYIIKPKLTADSPDLKPFETLHIMLANCINQKKSSKDCTRDIKLAFPSAEVSEQGNILKLNADGIKLAVALQCITCNVV